jgi:hypothetical protein
MNSEQLIDKIDIILDAECSQMKFKDHNFTIVDEKIIYPNSDRLVKIFNLIKQNDELKSDYLNYLKLKLTFSSYTFENCFELVMFTLMRLDKVDLLFEQLFQYSGNDVVFNFFYSFWKHIQSYFSEDDLIKIKKYCSNSKDLYLEALVGRRKAYPLAESLYDNISQILLDNLDVQLSNNFEFIEKDIDEFQEKISKHSFDDKIISYFYHLNEVILENPDEHTVAGEIGNFREVTRSFFLSLAENLKDFEGDEEIPKKTKTPIGNARIYIMDKLQLDGNDKNIFSKFDSFLDSFVDKTHDDGGHSYYTNPRTLKYIRNLGVTILSYLTECYESYIVSKKK